MNNLFKRKAKSIAVIAVAIMCALAFMPAGSGQVYAASKKPAKVKGVTLKQTTAKSKDGYTVRVTWKRVSKTCKYQVKIKNSKTQKVTYKRTKKGKTYASFSGNIGTTYVVKVRAVRGKKKGKWSKEKQIRIASFKTAPPSQPREEDIIIRVPRPIRPPKPVDPREGDIIIRIPTPVGTPQPVEPIPYDGSLDVLKENSVEIMQDNDADCSEPEIDVNIENSDISEDIQLQEETADPDAVVNDSDQIPEEEMGQALGDRLAD